MKSFKLLSVHTPRAINIGDYIQAVAAAQFLPIQEKNADNTIWEFVDREELKDYSGNPVSIIMNGWYMHNPTQWPPSDSINPLFVAFHINSTVYEAMLNEESIAYLKKHEPIGCRDINTMEKLQERGVNAYFTGCLTLTLGYQYYSAEKDGKIYFTEPEYDRAWSVLKILKTIWHLVMHCIVVTKITRKFSRNRNNLLKRYIHASSFHKMYSSFFDDQILTNAEYICQESEDYRVDCNENDLEYFRCAENLIKQYAKAKLVVTSRIHCALPCLGLGTPIIFINNLNQSDTKRSRMKGLLDLFNVINYENGVLKHTGDLSGKITLDSKIKNKETWKVYAGNLMSICSNWVSDELKLN